MAAALNYAVWDKLEFTVFPTSTWSLPHSLPVCSSCSDPHAALPGPPSHSEARGVFQLCALDHLTVVLSSLFIAVFFMPRAVISDFFFFFFNLL